jgi:hypothetical protein
LADITYLGLLQLTVRIHFVWICLLQQVLYHAYGFPVTTKNPRPERIQPRFAA